MMRIAIFLITNLAVTAVFGLMLNFIGIKSDSIQTLLITSLLFGFGGSLISLIMSKWIALKSINGNIIKNPSNEIESWLMQTISKQANQVKITTPQIVIYQAPDVNAFATGANKNSSLVAVSESLLKNMSRDEAEAVIAHEISHIASGDMVTMTLIQGVVNTFVIFISHIFAQITSNLLSNDRDDEEYDSNNSGNNQFIYFIVSTILELFFGMLASIIIMWFSRQREFYADAGSAKMVGREKMIAALKCLKNSYEPQEPKNIMAFCINGRYKSIILGELFMTHPPLDKRINALYRGEYMN